MRPPNPYNYNLPVGPEMFFGRDDDVETIVRGLTGVPGDSFALIGGRRMGKTSLLEALKRTLPGPAHKLLLVPIFLDMSGEGVNSLPAFFHAVLREAEEALADRLGQPLEAPVWDEGRPPARAFEHWLRACNRAVMDRKGEGLRLVLLLDECEQIVGHSWTPDLYNALRALLVGDSTRSHLKVVMAGSHRFLTQVRQEGSPLRNILKYHYLRVLSGEATGELVRRPTEGRLPEAVAQEVVRQSGGHPFLAQYLMHHLWERGLERASVEDVRRIVARFSHERDDFRVWLEGLGDTGRRAYALLVQAGPLSEDEIRARLSASLPDLPQALEALCYHGLVTGEAGGPYRVAGEMFRDWFVVHSSRPEPERAGGSPPPDGRSVHIGGSAQGNIIITGDGNVVIARPSVPPAGSPPPRDARLTIEPAVARIYSARGRVIGAGFLVGEREVLTCAHVVARALGLPDDTPEPPAEPLSLDFPLVAAGIRLTAQVVHWQPQNDVAVLELTCAPPPGAGPAPLAEGGDLWGHPFRAFGFPPTHPEGVWAGGVIRGPNARGWLQIEDTKEPGYRVQPGFSGSPVWDEVLKGVVGMVTAADPDPAVKAAFIIPTSFLPRTTQHAPRATQHVPNPFCDRGRINDPARLFNRERILRELRDLLGHGNSVSLVGEREIGKSSLLYALYRTGAEWFPGGTVHYVDLQVVVDVEDFCAEVLRGLGREGNSLRALKGALRSQRLVLLLDEVEKLTRPAFTADLHDLLRGLAQEPTFTLAVASHRPLAEIFPPSSDTSPFHNIFTEKFLGPFTPAESRAFLAHRLRGTGITFTPEEIDRLVAESGGHPARLQRLAYALFEEKLR